MTEQVTIVNVVATASLNQEIDFERLRMFPEIFYDSDVYGGRVAYFKEKFMQGKVSIFLNGKMISIGTKSERQAFYELGIVKDFLIQNVFIKDVELKPLIQNIVLTYNFNNKIDLEKFSLETGSIYEPEQFAGAILRLKKPFKVTALIFASGKIVIAGLKNEKNINSIIKLIDALLIQ